MIEGILSGYPIQNEIIDYMNTSRRNTDASESELDVDFQRVADNEKDSEVDGKSKKTKKKKLSLDERVKRDRGTHPLLPALCKCTTGCRNVINEEERKNIKICFWKLNYNERKNFLCQVARNGQIKGDEKKCLERKEDLVTTNTLLRLGKLIYLSVKNSSWRLLDTVPIRYKKQR